MEHIHCNVALPGGYGIPCTMSKFRKCIFGFNARIALLGQPRIGFEFCDGLKMVNGDRLSVDVFALNPPHWGFAN